MTDKIPTYANLADQASAMILEHNLIALPTTGFLKKPTFPGWNKVTDPLGAHPFWKKLRPDQQPTGVWVATTNWDPCEVVLDFDCEPDEIDVALEMLGLSNPEVFQTSASGGKHVCLKTARPLNFAGRFQLPLGSRSLDGDIRHCGSRQGMLWHGSQAKSKKKPGGAPGRYKANDTIRFFDRTKWQKLSESQTDQLEELLGRREVKQTGNDGHKATLNKLSALYEIDAKSFEPVTVIDHANEFCFGRGKWGGASVKTTRDIDTKALASGAWEVFLACFNVARVSIEKPRHEDSFRRAFIQECATTSEYMNNYDEERRADLGFEFSKSKELLEIEVETVKLFGGGIRLMRDEADPEKARYKIFCLSRGDMVQPRKPILSDSDLDDPTVRVCNLAQSDISTARNILNVCGKKFGLQTGLVIKFLANGKVFQTNWKTWLMNERHECVPSVDVLEDLRFRAHNLREKFDQAEMELELEKWRNEKPDWLKRIPYFMAPRNGKTIEHQPFISCLVEGAPGDLHLCFTEKTWRYYCEAGAEEELRALNPVARSETRGKRKVRCVPLDSLLKDYEPVKVNGPIGLTPREAA